jgi:hypothetical protein
MRGTILLAFSISMKRVYCRHRNAFLFSVSGEVQVGLPYLRLYLGSSIVLIEGNWFSSGLEEREET